MPLNCNQLHKTLAAENEALRSFVTLLRDEQHLLLSGKIDQLVSSAESKARLVTELTTFSEQRMLLLRNCGMTPDRAGMEQLLNEHFAGEGREADAWEELLRLATVAHQTNTSNGLLISSRAKNTQRALQALFSAARLPTAYAPDGATIGFRAPQRIAVA